VDLQAWLLCMAAAAQSAVSRQGGFAHLQGDIRRNMIGLEEAPQWKAWLRIGIGRQ